MIHIKYKQIMTWSIDNKSKYYAPQTHETVYYSYIIDWYTNYYSIEVIGTLEGWLFQVLFVEKDVPSEW